MLIEQGSGTAALPLHEYEYGIKVLPLRLLKKTGLATTVGPIPGTVPVPGMVHVPDPNVSDTIHSVRPVL